jgi:hypothetical protein
VLGAIEQALGDMPRSIFAGLICHCHQHPRHRPAVRSPEVYFPGYCGHRPLVKFGQVNEVFQVARLAG